MWQYNELYHHGIKGQKWGVRRFQNEDGTLTSAGKKRYSGEASDTGSASKKRDKKLEKAQKEYDKTLSKNYYRIYNAAVDYANEVLIPQINAEFEGRYDSPDYMKEYERRFNEAMGRAAVELFGSRPA